MPIVTGTFVAQNDNCGAFAGALGSCAPIQLVRNTKSRVPLLQCFLVPDGGQWNVRLEEAESVLAQAAHFAGGNASVLAENNRYKVRFGGENGPVVMRIEGNFWSQHFGYRKIYISDSFQKKLFTMKQSHHTWNIFHKMFGRYSYLIMPCNMDGCDDDDYKKALYTIEKDKWGRRWSNLLSSSYAQTWRIYKGYTNTKVGFGTSKQGKENQRFRACTHYKTTDIYKCTKTCHTTVKCQSDARYKIPPCKTKRDNNCVAAQIKQEGFFSYFAQGVNDHFAITVHAGGDPALAMMLNLALDVRNDHGARTNGEGVSVDGPQMAADAMW